LNIIKFKKIITYQINLSIILGGSMKKALWLLFLLTLLAGNLFAQYEIGNTNSINSDRKSDISSLKAIVKQIDESAAVLWDNFTNISITNTGTLYASGQYPDAPANQQTLKAADDFLVPQSEIWNISEVWLDGFSDLGGAILIPDYWVVEFWNDDGGVPGTLIERQEIDVDLASADFPATIALNNAVQVMPGRNWVTVFPFWPSGEAPQVTAFGDPTDQFFAWFMGTAGIGEEYAVYDDNGWIGITAGWESADDPDFSSLAFTLSGTTEIVGPGYATNPFPANNAIDIPQAGTTLTWTNPGGAKALDYNEVYFSSDKALVEARDESVKVLGDGASVYSEYETGELEYNTTYYWAVDNTELAKAPGTTFGPLWKFTVEPAYPEFTWIDDFEAGTDNWDIYGVDGSFCEWEADESPWDNGYAMPPTASGTILRADSDLCGSGTTMNTYLEMNKGVDLSDFAGTTLIWDGDQRVLGGTLFEVDLSIDGGLSWMNVFSENADRRTETVAIPVPEADFQADVRFRFHYEAHGWHWWWAIDNVTIHALTPLTSMYGYLMHPNENPISGATLRMESEEKYIFETTTDEDGWFEFMEVPPGTFWMDIVSDYPAYTLDTRDAFLVSKQANKTEPYPTGDMFFVSDVTADGEVRWNDAVMIFERIFGDIDGFNQPDWLGTFGDEAFVHGGEDMDMGILYAWLAGDADFSYGNTLRSLKMLEVTKSGSRSLAIGSEVSVPYYVTSDAEVSAAMMRFNYSDKYEFVGLDSKLANATVINGEGFVGIMYIDKPVNFNSGDELLTLNFRLKDGQEVPEDFEITVDEKSAMLEKSGNFVTTGLQTLSFGEVIPTKYELTQNYPNPFNPTTKISFSLPQADVVTLKVYDILGSEVATLVNEKLEAGVYEFNFNASNLPSGAYIYRIQTDNFQSTKKMMLLK